MRVHRNTDPWITEHDSGPVDDDALALKCSHDQSHLPGMNTMAGHQWKRFRSFSLNDFQFHSKKKERNG